MMKQVILTLAIIYPFLVMGQNSGEITYKETIRIEIELPEGMEQFANMVPSEQSFQKVLLFDATQNLYKDAEKKNGEENETSSEEDGVQMKIAFSSPDNQLYCNTENGRTLERRSFMEKKFLIEGKAKRYKWEMTGEQKNILDYTCQKAIYKDTSKTVVAWYTSQIPVSAGPSAYAGLPGIILELDINEGSQLITATKIALKVLDKESITKPKKGKKVSEEEFNAIVDQKTKEMQEEYGGSGNVIIKTTISN